MSNPTATPAGDNLLKVAVLDDYSDGALGDWSKLAGLAQVTSFPRHLSAEEAPAALADFDVICTVRERTPLPRALLAALPKLKLVTVVGNVRSITNLDFAAATELGIRVAAVSAAKPGVDMSNARNATPELTWGLVIATARHMTHEGRRMYEGGWQSKSGVVLAGRTLGVLGLGNIGKRVAQYGQAFGMEVIAWSQNLTAEAASAVGVRRVEKDELFAQSDVLSVHLVLSDRSRGLVGARELGLMKPTAYLINTARAAIVDQAALLAVLQAGRIAGAGLDVFETEPPPADHPFRTLPNVTLTPHLGYATSAALQNFQWGMAELIGDYASGRPIELLNPEVEAAPRR